MNRNRRKTSRASVFVFVVISCIAVMWFSIMPVQACVDPSAGFASEVLLNNSNVTYDFSTLKNYAKDGFVNIIKIEEAEGASDTFESDPKEEESPYPDSGNPDEIENDWEPGIYYLYRSHYASELGVVIHEETGLPDVLTLSGLSLNLVIPTKLSEITIKWETAILNLDLELELDESLIEFMENQGYEESGTAETTGGTYEDPEEKLVGIVFSKGEAEIYLSCGEGGKTLDGKTGAGETVIWVEGAEDTIDSGIDQDIKDMLEFLNVNPDEWDDAKREKHSRQEYAFVPSVSIDPKILDWSTAMRFELEWLINQSIISGLTENDIQQIASNAKAGNAGYNSRVIYANGTWKSYFETGAATFKDDCGSLVRLTLNDLPAIAGKEITNSPKEFTYTSFVIIGAIVAFIALGTFSYSRLKRRSILDNLNRQNIFEYIKANPGVHFKKLLRELNFKPGALSYHLNVLEKEEYIKSIQHGNYRRFYLFGTKSDLKIALTSIQLRILSIVNERPGISQSNISKTLGKNRMLINYHIKILADAGILSLEKSGRESQCFTTETTEHYLTG